MPAIDSSLIPLIAVSGAFWVAILVPAFLFTYKAWKTSSDNALKRDMVARGYTAQEIIAVIAAERRSESTWARDMVARGYPAEEVVAVMEAERRAGTQLPLPNVPPAKPIKQPAF
jgi:SOS response regulatory protein OraA/RecX